jgi:hypothetical protein
LVSRLHDNDESFTTPEAAHALTGEQLNSHYRRPRIFTVYDTADALRGDYRHSDFLYSMTPSLLPPDIDTIFASPTAVHSLSFISYLCIRLAAQK